MARQVQELVRRRGRPVEHNWDQFLDGNVWELTYGEDFTSQARSFTSQARRAAEAKGMKLATRTVQTGPLRENPENPKSKKLKDDEGNVIEDAIVVQIQAYTPDEDEGESDTDAA